MSAQGKSRFINVIRTVLILLLLLSIAYVVFVFAGDYYGWNKQVLVTSDMDSSVNFDAVIPESDSSYEEIIKSKKIFFNPASVVVPVPVVKTPDPVVVPKVPEIPIEQITQNYSLVAVLNGTNPQAIIADKKNNRTHYLSVGQFLGDVKLESVEDKKVILNYKGRTFELYL